VSNIKIGDGLKAGTQLGPLINQAAIKKINSLVEDALQKGATMLYQSDLEVPQNSCLMAVKVLKISSTEAQIENSEVFGPIIPIYEFDNDDLVIERANNTVYGLASYFYTNNLARIHKVSQALEYGMVAVNDVTLSTELTSFGGVKQSGIGREGGKNGIFEYLEEKFIAINY
jgi:succinate-semialdehyde dehydrogenase/glutarate-semialdehyde dehydrogenase